MYKKYKANKLENLSTSPVNKEMQKQTISCHLKVDRTGTVRRNWRLHGGGRMETGVPTGSTTLGAAWHASIKFDMHTLSQTFHFEEIHPAETVIQT